jgi:hypothetical protein
LGRAPPTRDVCVIRSRDGGLLAVALASREAVAVDTPRTPAVWGTSGPPLTNCPRRQRFPSAKRTRYSVHTPPPAHRNLDGPNHVGGSVSAPAGRCGSTRTPHGTGGVGVRAARWQVCVPGGSGPVTVYLFLYRAPTWREMRREERRRAQSREEHENLPQQSELTAGGTKTAISGTLERTGLGFVISY